MQLRIIFALIWICWHSLTCMAQTIGMQPPGAITLLVDEDWLDQPRNQDRNYTGGMGLEFHGGWIYRKIGKHMDVMRLFRSPGQNDSILNTASFQVTTSMFTPQDLRSWAPIYDDRPYSNLTVVTFRNNYVKDKYNLVSPRRAYYDISVGAIGLQLGREFQTQIHKWVCDTVGSPIPRGWPHQVSNGGKPTMLFRLGYDISPYGESLKKKWILFRILDYKIGASASAGYYNLAEFNASVRFGLIKANWMNVPNRPPNELLSNKKGNGSLKNLELYVFISGRTYYMFYNSLLKGQIAFPEASDVKLLDSQINHHVSEVNGGISFGGKYWLVTLKLNARTPEIKKYNYPFHSWGSAYVTGRCSF